MFFDVPQLNSRKQISAVLPLNSFKTKNKYPSSLPFIVDRNVPPSRLPLIVDGNEPPYSLTLIVNGIKLLSSLPFMVDRNIPPSSLPFIVDGQSQSISVTSHNNEGVDTVSRTNLNDEVRLPEEDRYIKPHYEPPHVNVSEPQKDEEITGTTLYLLSSLKLNIPSAEIQYCK